jgi:hypothetical protein
MVQEPTELQSSATLALHAFGPLFACYMASLPEIRVTREWLIDCLELWMGVCVCTSATAT